MEVAVKQGFDVGVVALPGGEDPAEVPDSFKAGCPAESYLLYRVDYLERTGDRQGLRVAWRSSSVEDSRSVRRRSGSSPTGSIFRGDTSRRSRPRGVERRGSDGFDALSSRPAFSASAISSRRSAESLARSGACGADSDHFDDPLHRRFRSSLCGAAEDELVALRAELGRVPTGTLSMSAPAKARAAPARAPSSAREAQVEPTSSARPSSGAAGKVRPPRRAGVDGRIGSGHGRGERHGRDA